MISNKTYFVEYDGTLTTSMCQLVPVESNSPLPVINAAQVDKVPDTNYWRIRFEIGATAAYSLVIDNNDTIFYWEYLFAVKSHRFTNQLLKINNDNQLEGIDINNGFNLNVATSTETKAMTSDNTIITPKKLLDFIWQMQNVLGMTFEDGINFYLKSIINKNVITDSNGKLIGQDINTAFNKNFGDNSDNVAKGNHDHINLKIRGDGGGYYNIKSITDTLIINSSVASAPFNITIPEGAVIEAFQAIIVTDLDIGNNKYDIKLVPSGGGSNIPLKTGMSSNLKNNKINETFDIHSNLGKISSDSVLNLIMETGTINSGSIRATVYYKYLNPMSDISSS